MPYMGVVIPDGNNSITIKLHGTFKNYVVNPIELRETAIAIWEKFISNNIPSKVDNLAKDICHIFCNGVDILWVNVEYVSSFNRNIFGASAEKERENVDA